MTEKLAKCRCGNVSPMRFDSGHRKHVRCDGCKRRVVGKTWPEAERGWDCMQSAETFTRADLESLAEYVAHDISGGAECYGSNVHKIIDAFLAQRRKP